MPKSFSRIFKLLVPIILFCVCLNLALPAANANIWYEISDNLLIFEEEDVYHSPSRENPLQTTIVNIVGYILGLLGLLFLILVLYGGFAWLLSGGNEERVKKARDIILHGIIGLAIVLGAYAISWFVVRGLITGFSQY